MENTRRVLVIDDEESFRHMLSVILQKEGYQVETASDGYEALEKMEGALFDEILCDIRMPRMDGIRFLREVKKTHCDSTIIMMSAYGTLDTAVEAMKLGAYDYVSKPFKPDEIVLTLKKAEERERLRRENIYLRKEIEKEYNFNNIISKNEKMAAIFDTIKKVARYKSTILITGESGTGKELVAKAIHFNSDRSANPFIPVNCGAIPENLLESELFGHVKGSFTDAVRTKKGLFEEANGGTLFLDEIGELPLSLQVKLLRVLQDGEIRRVGDSRSIKIDVRIIAATVKDLESGVKQGSFRDDLFYRLNVLPLKIPPLRERREDIPLLVDHFIEKFNQNLGKRVSRVTPEALKILLRYSWPGNVRELENMIERGMVLTETDTIDVENLPPEVYRSAESSPFSELEEYSIKKATRILETELIRKALRKTHGNHTHASRILEISHRTLLYKIKEYGIGQEK
ncbi:MAG: sigma-54-dependent Fis family transcriptional regulator [Deltaproteobacteria bacterium]|nr:sigma-54-dependent Fis family transcriptional regulator [Deltaproteobacteria bacterium]